MFNPDFRKTTFLGQAINRTVYSIVNQQMHTISTTAKYGLSVLVPSESLFWMSGCVFKHKVMVDIITIADETKEIIYKENIEKNIK